MCGELLILGKSVIHHTHVIEQSAMYLPALLRRLDICQQSFRKTRAGAESAAESVLLSAPPGKVIRLSSSRRDQGSDRTLRDDNGRGQRASEGAILQPQLCRDDG